jgi:16S rRNA (cytosine1407-C5)-methyltransferase
MKRKNKKPIQEISPEAAQQQSLQRFEPLLSAEEFTLLQEEIKHPLLPTIRVNPLKTTAGAIEGWQHHYGWQVQPIPFCEAGFRVDDSAGTSVSQTLEHRLGYYYIQEAASMLPPELFTFDTADPGLTLDLAASPGGKTTHLVARGLDHGLVMANDSSQGRIPALRIVLQNWGAVNTAITQFPGEKFGPWFPGTFDRVLLDAPCSMQGLRVAESHDLRPVTEKESLQLAKRQTALLTSALQAVKIGGEVVYSTCTLLPEEDEGVIDAVLRRFGAAVEIRKIPLPLSADVAGITRNSENTYLPEVAGALRLWPHRLGTAGFFACLLKKTSELDLPTSMPPARPLEKTGFEYANKIQEISRALQSDYGFALEGVLTQYDLTLMKRYEKLFVFPNRVLDQFVSLPLESTGMVLGETIDGELIPSHEWVVRFGDRFKAGTLQLDEGQSAAFARGEDCFDIAANNSNKGKVVVVRSFDGLVLGRGKLLKDRLKNLLPRRLV